MLELEQIERNENLPIENESDLQELLLTARKMTAGGKLCMKQRIGTHLSYDKVNPSFRTPYHPIMERR